MNEKTRWAHPWRPAAWLRVEGEDAFTFLQGQFTNDLRQLEQHPAVYGLWLNQKGRVVADSFVLRADPEAFWVGSYGSPAAVIRERLESYVIADDVRIEDETEHWEAVAVNGVGGEDLAGRAWVFPGRRGVGESVEVVYPRASSEVSARWADWPRRSAEAMLRARIEAGIPWVPIDIGPGELPNEGGLEREAVSYTKGCYLGQEVMARLKSMGRVRRRLVRVAGPGAPPALPTSLYRGEKPAGELRSAVATEDGFVGLALLSLLAGEPTAPLSLEPGGPAAIRVEAEASG